MSPRLVPSLVAFLALGSVTARAQSPPPLAELETIGTGTPGSTGIPRLVSIGRPAVLEPGMSVYVEGGLPGAPALLVVGPAVDPTPLPRFGATLVPQLPALRVALGVLDGQGTSQPFASGPAPASAALLGLDFAVQALVADPGAQGGAAFTAGLRLRFGVGFAAPGMFAGLSYPAQHSIGSLTEPDMTGDLDEDGRRDLLMFSPATSTIQVFRQLVDGTFAPPVGSPVPWIANGAIADVDGDGHLDVVMAKGTLDSSAVLVANGVGDGRFEPGITLSESPGAGPLKIAIDDVDADGAPDLLAANWSANHLGVLAGFQGPAVHFPLWGDARAMRVGDLTGDGQPDVFAIVSAPGLHISVLTGLGGGDFSFPTLTPLGIEDPAHLELGDLDGDGDLDALVGGWPPFGGTTVLPTLHVLVNDGAGAFQPGASVPTTDVPGVGVRQLELADVEPDGDLDVLAVHELVMQQPVAPVTLLANLGAGVLDEPVPLVNLRAIDAADLDGDGVVDLCGVSSSFFARAPQIFRGLGGGHFDLPERFPEMSLFPCGAGDFDGDGDMDVAGRFDQYPQPPAIALSLWSDAVGIGLPKLYDAQGAIPQFEGLVVADADGDSRPDVVAAGQDTVRIFRGDGIGGLQSPLFEALPKAIVPRVADIDGDGRPDLVVARRELGLSVLLGLPGGGFAPAVTTPAPTAQGLECFEVADVDGDDRLDVVAQAVSGFHVLRGIGDGSFVTEFVSVPGTGQSQELPLVLADFDDDGDPDLARYDWVGLAIWENDGAGGFTAGQVNAYVDLAFTLEAADFNLDGALDLLGGELRLGFGDGTFAAPHVGIADGALADFDRDGDVDVFVYDTLFRNRVR